MSEFEVLAPTDIDYEAEGLMVGLEFHQQVLASYNDLPTSKKYGSKLFCSCPALLRDDDPDFELKRKFRAVSGETGDIDITSQFEKNKQSVTIYEGYHDTTCLIELDEEPILPINEEALFRTLAIAKKIFKLELVDEILVSRKAIIDGSNTSGFQRTSQIAYGSDLSFIDVNGKKISVYQANLEEDSAKNVGTKGKVRKFRLDRLGIPLIEIATGPDIRSPDEALATAIRIGDLLRTTGFVKRGQGTIRQDLNVSITKGTRIEIKGVSDLELLPVFVRNEAIRQFRMIELLSILKAREITKRKIQNITSKDVSKIFSKTDAKFIKNALKKKETVIGARLPSFEGLIKFELQPDYRLGTELSEISKVSAGVGGILHSDELPKFGISKEEVDAVKKDLKLKSNDGFILIIGDSRLADLAIEGIKNTLIMWLVTNAVLPEVRSPKANGTTGFLRPLPGKARMYPETDAKPILLSEQMINKINAIKFEMPEERVKRYQTKLKLSGEQANQLALHQQNSLFEEIIKKHKVDPKLVATTMLSTIIDIRRQGFDIEKISDDILLDIFELVSKDELSPDALSPLLIGISQSKGDIDLDQITKELNLGKMDESDAIDQVRAVVINNIDLVKERGMGAMGSLMRLAMERLGGKVDGKIVSNLVRKEIQEQIK